MDIQVVDNAEQQRFEAVADDGQMLGFVAYDRRPDTVVFTHTEVDDASEGQGVGSRLVRGALEQMRTEGKRVRPDCPFVSGWIDAHPDYADLVSPTASPPAG